VAGRQVQLQAPTTLYNVSTLQQQQVPQQYALHPSQSSLFAAQGNQFFTPPTHTHTQPKDKDKDKDIQRILQEEV
jgi:hypothetical protein